MKETERREFKKSLAELKTGLISIAAILNKHGKGELWFGIRNDGKAVGLEVTDKTLRNLSQSIAAHIEPRIYPHVTQENVGDVSCIKVAFEGGDKPYYALGRAYMRVADEDRQLSARELEKMIIDKNRQRLRWDNQPCDLSIDALEHAKLQAFVERAGLKWDRPENALDKLGLLSGPHLLNAAKLFFTTEPMELRCAVFGTTDSSMIIDRHDIQGDILELIEEAQKYVLKNIHIGMRLEGLYRVDVPEISVDALREAIINAFCHRDYRDPDYVQVAIFKNRVEIRNPGGLYGTITLDDLRKGYISQRRNPLIADLFKRIEMVEAWGRGMPLILANAPDVVFREVGSLFIVSFNRPSFTEAKEIVPAKDSGATPKIPPETTPNKLLKRRESVGKASGKILDICRERCSVTIPELADMLGITERSVERNIQKLQANELLRRVGGRKSGHWQVLKESPEQDLGTTQETTWKTSGKSSGKEVPVKPTKEAKGWVDGVVENDKTAPITSGKRRKSVGKASEKILDICRERCSVTIPELAAMIGITERSVERNIQKLQANELLRRVGGRKYGHWEVLK